jgi:GNAT superfamily N-acetyltransferase
VVAVERLAQDRGLRLVRTRIPEVGILEDYFRRRGYVGISREGGAEGEGGARLMVEKRLPLLTVREQRRGDAGAIAALTGEDPWPFEQMARPGWFVAADGERVVGAIGVRDGGAGVARLTAPVVAEGYAGRGLEPWMVDRAAYYAETNGYHTGELPVTAATRGLERALEDRRWFPEGDLYVRRFVGRAAERRDE